MRKQFPQSYPYLTKSGLVITKELLEELIKELFLTTGEKGLEFGLEMSYMLLWAMDNIEDEDKLFEQSIKMFKSITRRSPSSAPNKGHREIGPEEWESMLGHVDLEETEIRIDIKNIEKKAGMKLADMSRVAKYRLLQKLKGKMETGDDR